MSCRSIYFTYFTSLFILINQWAWGQLTLQISATPPGSVPVVNPLDNIYVCQGSAVVLNVLVNGSVGTVNYQWFYADVNGLSAIVGANTATYATATQEGEYFVQVIDANNPTGIFSPSVFICLDTGVPINVTVQSTTGVTNICSGSGTGITLTAQAQNPPSTGFCGNTPISFVWFRGVTQVGTGSTYNISNNPAEAGVYRVRAVNRCGFAENSINITIIDNPPTNALITSNDNSNTLCVNGTLQLNASAQGQGLSYQWFRNGTAISNATNTFFVVNYNSAISYPETYKVRISNGCGFTETANFQVFLATPPTNVHIQALGNTNFCDDAQVILTPNSTGFPPTRYEWYKNGSLIQTNLFPFVSGITYTATESGDYTVKIFNKCANTISPILSVNEAITPTFINLQATPNASLGCGQSSFQLTALTDGSNLRYEWYKNTVLVQNSALNTLTVNDIGNYHVKAIAELNNGTRCGELSSATITISQVSSSPSSISLSSLGSITNTCTGEITLIANATGESLQYEWFRNNLLVATTLSTNFNASLSGSYTVRATNACGNSATSNAINITISQTPTNVTITTPDPTTGCGFQNVRLQANAIGLVDRFEWFRNGNKVAEGITYLATQNGAYTVKVTNTCGSITSDTFTINFIQAPTNAVIIPLSTPTICGNVSVPLSVQTDGNNLIYTWFKNGIVVSNDAIYLANDLGTYTVSIVNACGNAVALPFVINSIANLVEPTILPANNLSICAGTKVTLTANSPVSGVNFRWFRNNQLIAGANNNTLETSEAGTYIVEISKDNCSALSQGRQITVSPAPTLLLTFSGSLNFCEGDSVRLQVRSQDVTMQFEWFKNNQSLQKGAIFTAKQAGNYTIKGTNSCGIILTENFMISTQQRLTPKISWQNGILTIIDTAKVYQWLFNDLPILNANQRTYTPLEAGKYAISIINDTGCSGNSEAIDFNGWNTEEDGFVSILPNPNDGIFTVRVLTNEIAQVQLFTILGQEITEHTLQRANSLVNYQQFDFSGLIKGLYILKVELKNKVIGKKIIVWR